MQEPHNEGVPNRVTNVFKPDVLLPSQFFGAVYGQAPVKSGECRLLFALLEDAVACFQRYVLATRRDERHLFNAVRSVAARRFGSPSLVA